MRSMREQILRRGRSSRKKQVDVLALLSDDESFLDHLDIRVRRNRLKRAFDIIFGLFAFLVTLPVLIPALCLIALTSRGSPFFKSKRIGLKGRVIYCYKLRTMYIDAEERLSSLLQSSPKIADEYAAKRKITSDPRVTFIGYFLRKYSIDEIPQFLNVIFGDLSVVGPRPYFARELKEIEPAHLHELLCVRPGVTGPWQISGRSDISFVERTKMEIPYAKTWSWASDFKYIFKTLPAVLRSKGAL